MLSVAAERARPAEGTERADTASPEDAVRNALLAQAVVAHRLAAWILHDTDAAEDAVQEAALLAWDRRRSLRSTDAVDAWFNRILVNVCRQELRRRARLPQLRPLEGGLPVAAQKAPGGAGDDLTAAIRRLTPDEQILVALRYGRDLSVPQIAAIVDVPVGTVKSRPHYALDHLRAALDAERRAQEALR